MSFESVKTPNQLMDFLDKNFRYGVIDNNGNKFYDSNSHEFQMVCNFQWKLRTIKEMLRDGIGHCYDQVEIEREWFEKNGYEIKTFWISAYQKEIQNSGFSHTYLIYKENGSWNIFEHSDFFNKGIHKFSSIKDAVKWQAEHQVKFAKSCVKPKNKYSVCIKEYNKPPTKINMKEYLNFIDKLEDYVL
ncbi:MAG: hypothetical protein ACI4R8_03220 [Candidatus Caccovivens sp.]